VEVTISLEEVAHGATREIRFNRNLVCSTCNGNGSRPAANHNVAPIAAGAGRSCSRLASSVCRQPVRLAVERVRGLSIHVRLPWARNDNDQGSLGCLDSPRRDEGMRVRLTGEGDASIDGALPVIATALSKSNNILCFIETEII
jgi:molecular chaperone DnaJ